MPAWLYILRLKSGALYIGATADLNQRYKDHCTGKACRTTSLDPPVAVIYIRGNRDLFRCAVLSICEGGDRLCAGITVTIQEFSLYFDTSQEK